MKKSPPRSATINRLVNATRNLVQHKGSTVDQAVFLQELMDVFGGPRDLARAMYEDYQAGQPGSLIRQKTMQAIQHLIISTTQFNLTKVVNASELSDEELERTVGDYLGKIEAGRLVPPSGAEAESTTLASDGDALEDRDPA